MIATRRPDGRYVLGDCHGDFETGEPDHPIETRCGCTAVEREIERRKARRTEGDRMADTEMVRTMLEDMVGAMSERRVCSACSFSRSTLRRLRYEGVIPKVGTVENVERAYWAWKAGALK